MIDAHRPQHKTARKCSPQKAALIYHQCSCLTHATIERMTGFSRLDLTVAIQMHVAFESSLVNKEVIRNSDYINWFQGKSVVLPSRLSWPKTNPNTEFISKKEEKLRYIITH